MLCKYASASGSPQRIAEAIKRQVDHVVSRFGVPANEVRSRVRSVSKISGYTQCDIEAFAKAARANPDTEEHQLCGTLGIFAGQDDRGTFFRPS